VSLSRDVETVALKLGTDDLEFDGARELVAAG
jgi:hypothetical protein